MAVIDIPNDDLDLCISALEETDWPRAQAIAERLRTAKLTDERAREINAPLVLPPSLLMPIAACKQYKRPAGVLGGPCITCGRSQPEHVPQPGMATPTKLVGRPLDDNGRVELTKVPAIEKTRQCDQCSLEASYAGAQDGLRVFVCPNQHLSRVPVR